MLSLAAALLVLTGIAHSYLGERYLLMRLFRRDNLPEILGSVGAYHFEGPGVQLFEKIEGDYFTILGLPMLALLAGLRELDLIDA